MGGGQDGESVIRPEGGAQILAVTWGGVGGERWGFSLKFADLAFPFSCGPGTELADWVCEPLL